MGSLNTYPVVLVPEIFALGVQVYVLKVVNGEGAVKVTDVLELREHKESVFLDKVKLGGVTKKTESVTGPPQQPCSDFKLHR